LRRGRKQPRAGRKWIWPQPHLAGELARERLIGPGVVLIGTVRRDGTPRISPVEPFMLEGELWLSMMRRLAEA
jgi:hypothetical protein